MSEFTKGKWEVTKYARLIAAAPEMYKLLNYIAGVYANVLTLSDAEKIDNLLARIDGWEV